MNIKNPNHTMSLSDGTSITYSDILRQHGGRTRSRVISRSGGTTVTLKSGEGRPAAGGPHVKGTWMTFLPASLKEKPVFIPREIEEIPVEEVAALI